MQISVLKFISRHHLLQSGQKVIVGVSGGADSIALLHILSNEGFNCVAAHCNFHLRGDESDRDELFVKDFCQKKNIPLEVIHFDTKAVASELKISIEMAARELRYKWFEKLRLKHEAEAIAVAHHKDDAAETFLLNLIRGTGIRGLSGMAPKNGYIIRPLLCLSRKEVEEYLQNNHLSFVTDSSNEETLYTRNKIRLEIIPLLEQINPSVKESILQTANNLFDTSTIYFKEIERIRKSITSLGNDNLIISIEKLKQTPAIRSVIFELLNPYGFNSSVCEEIYESLDGQSGKQFFSSEYRLIKDRENLILEKLNKQDTENILIESPETFVNDPVALNFEIKDAEGFTIPKDKNIACFDADKVSFPLTLRRWENGDKFVPFGMKGSKKLSDYFSDHKFSLVEKEKAFVLCTTDKIIWLIGERTDNRFRVDEKTKKVLVVKIIP